MYNSFINNARHWADIIMDIIEIILKVIIVLSTVALIGICAYCYVLSEADPLEL